MPHKHKWEYPPDPLARMKGIHGLYRRCRCGVSQRYNAAIDICTGLKIQNTTSRQQASRRENE